MRTANKFPRPPLGGGLADTSQPKFQNYWDLCEGLTGNGGPRGPWDKENAIDDRKDGNEVEGNGGSYGSTDETQSEGLGSPYYGWPPVQSL